IPPDLNPTERATFISKEADGFFRGLMGDRQEQHDRMDVVKMAVDASPTKVAIVGTTTTAGGLSKFDLKNSEPFDHVLIAYYDYNEEKYVIAEMMTNDSKGDSVKRFIHSEGAGKTSTLQEAAVGWDRFMAVPVTLTEEQDAALRISAAEKLSG